MWAHVRDGATAGYLQAWFHRQRARNGAKKAIGAGRSVHARPRPSVGRHKVARIGS
jgi:hypothetical protein